MAGPARAGLSVYAKDKNKLTSFYKGILGMTEVHSTEEISVLESPDIQLVVHRMPEDRASEVLVETPPVLHDSAIKFFFTVEDMAAAKSLADELGGGLGDEYWQGPSFVVCNGFDPEGNVFHVRQNRNQLI